MAERPGYTAAAHLRNFLNSKEELHGQIATLLGRSAEEIVFGKITTGAANDLQRAGLAEQMVTRRERHPRTAGLRQARWSLPRDAMAPPLRR